MFFQFFSLLGGKIFWIWIFCPPLVYYWNTYLLILFRIALCCSSLLTKFFIEMSRHRASKDENRLINPTIIGTRIKYFWIYDANLNNNIWITGVVTKEKENMKGYYIVKFPTFPGRATKIIVPLTNEKFHPLWRRCDEQDDEDDEKVESSCSTTTPSASSVRTWIQCTRKGCTNWVQLPVGLHRICKTFCCTDASLWGKVLETCANPKPTKIKVVEQLVRKRPAPAAPVELSAYEILRLKNVQRNQEFLTKLGLSSARSHPAVAESVGGSDSRTPSKKRKKTKQGGSEGTTPVVVQRKSERSRKERSFLRDEETERSKKKATATAARFVKKSSAQHYISELLPPSSLLLLPFWWSWSRCNY